MHPAPSGQPPTPTPPAPRRKGPLIALCAGGGFIVIVLALLTVIGLTVDDPNESPAAASAASSPASSAPPASPPAARPSATSAAPRPSAKPTRSASPTPTGPRPVPSPNARQERTYLATIARIDEGLVVNEERAMRRAGRVCERIIRPPGGTLTLPKYVVLEMSGGNAQINERQAAQIIRAVKVWCR